jgi:aminoglycoside 3-N-acetyltransferase I
MIVEIQVLKPSDLKEFQALIKVFEDVFEMEDFKIPNDAHLQKLLEKEGFFAVAAKHENKVIGGLTVYTIDQYYSLRPLAYIYDLAVMVAYQRKGIGKKLIEFTNEYCRQKGYEEVFVQVDKVDDYALDFYRSTVPSAEEHVVHFYYKF